MLLRCLRKTNQKTSEKKVEYCIGDYWTLTTGHHDWGYDSVDSIEIFDLCSRDCIQKKLDEYLKDCSGTDYFELSHENDWEVNSNMHEADERLLNSDWGEMEVQNGR
jgi:hypothetical protein